MAVRNYHAFTLPMSELVHHTVAFINQTGAENIQNSPRVDRGMMDTSHALTNGIWKM